MHQYICGWILSENAFFALIAEYLTDQLAENAKLCTFVTFHLSQQRKMLNFAHLYLSINPCIIKLMIWLIEMSVCLLCIREQRPVTARSDRGIKNRLWRYVRACAEARAKNHIKHNFWGRTNHFAWNSVRQKASDSNMSGNEGDDPKYDESFETKRIEQINKEEAELTSFCTRNEG